MASLNCEQEKVKSLVEKGFSVFVTGKGGSGKSFFLRNVIKEFSGKCQGLYITAPTGIAAANIGGTTIHSFAAIGTGKKSAHELVANIKDNTLALERWKSCQILVIDEVSMLSRELFEKLEFIARAIKESNKPFGGIQLILSGDFYQLKPVVSSKDKILDEEVFCFASPMWEKCVDFNVFLSTVHRQSQPELIDVLNDFRSCKLSMFTSNFVRHNLTRPLPCGPLSIVRLYSHVKDASESNAKCLDLLHGECLRYLSKDSGDVGRLSTCTAQKILILKVNARVVLLRNIDSDLVNGLCGNVMSFVGGFPMVKFSNGKVSVLKECLFTVEEDGHVVATRNQIPLDLAYALTIHRSQGMEFEYLEVYLDKVFEPGQSYVAVSRAKTVEGLRVVGQIKNPPQISQTVVDFYKSKVVCVQELSYDAIHIQPKKQEVYSLPSLDVTKASPVASGIPEPEEIILLQDYVDKHVPEDGLKDIITKIKLECEMSQDCNDVASKLQLHGNSIPQSLQMFFAWLWCVFSQISEDKSDAETAKVVERKKWTGHTKKIHALYRSKQLLLKWKESMASDGISIDDKDIDIGGKHRKVAVVFARATYEVFTHQQAKPSKEQFFNGSSNFKEGPVEFLTNEAKGKIRDIGGWVISEEAKSCIAYINSHKGSKITSVMEKLDQIKEVKKLIDSMTQNQEETVANTKYPETLEHILNYDRGAKTHISDVVFEFFIDLGSGSTAIFSENNLHRYKENALSVAYSTVKNNLVLQRKFQDLIIKCSQVNAQTIDDCDITTFDGDCVDGANTTSNCSDGDPEHCDSDKINTCTSYTCHDTIITETDEREHNLDDMDEDTTEPTPVQGTVIKKMIKSVQCIRNKLQFYYRKLIGIFFIQF